MNKRNGDDLRLFVACELSAEITSAIGDVQEGLRREVTGQPLRWVRPEGIHLTLKFLGAVPRSKVDLIKEALAAVIEPFSLTVRPARIGSFGGARIRVVWIGLDGDVDGLASLAGRVDESLVALGFEREKRPFAAHLTLARVRDDVSEQTRRELATLIRSHSMPALPSMVLSEVSLMESRLGPGGASYQRLGAFP